MNDKINVAERLMQNHNFRQQLRQHDADALAQIGYVLHADADEPPTFKVVTSTQDITYVQMPPLPSENYDVSASELGQIQAAGAGSASTVGSAGTASTLGTLTSTASSGGCIASVGTAATGGSS